jgi:hypothetical protein
VMFLDSRRSYSDSDVDVLAGNEAFSPVLTITKAYPTLRSIE